MGKKNTRGNGGRTRRSALKAGVTLSSGLVFSGAAIGTVAAQMATARAVPVAVAVRAEGDSEPSPTPDPQDKLVHRASGFPVDDGTDHEILDGSHQLRWGEFSALAGRATMKCMSGGTKVKIDVAGLVKGGLYTIWVCEFEDPGIVPSRDHAVALQNLVGCAPLGANDGSENVFRTTGGRGTIEAIDKSEPYTIVLPGKEVEDSPDCLHDADQIVLIGVLHLDDETHGPVPGDPEAGDHVDQFAFIF